MRVKVLKDGLFGDANLSAGDVVDMDAGLARRIFARGDGVPASDQVVAVPSAVEPSRTVRKPAAGN